MDSWFDEFKKWVDNGDCFMVPEGLPFDAKDYVKPQNFYPCLREFLVDNKGKNYVKNIRFSNETNPMRQKIVGYKQTMNTNQIKSVATEGPQFLTDLRFIQENYGVPGTFSYDQSYLDYEMYFLFVYDTFVSCVLSIIAIVIVVFLITGDIITTGIVTLSILLVDYYLLALIYYWSLTFNMLITINLVMAIGLSVDYSCHIAVSYLEIRPPPECDTPAKIRMYKSRQALSQIGSAVLHGGLSTFLSIVALAPSKSYIFVVFFKMWFGIIVFGLANGFMLTPVLLSFFGPTYTLTEPHKINMRKQKNPDDEKRYIFFCYCGKKKTQEELELADFPLSERWRLAGQPHIEQQWQA